MIEQQVARGAPEHDAGTAVRGGTLRINLASDTDTVDPALVAHVVSAQYQYAAQAKLLNYPDLPSPAGSTLVPEVAVDLPNVSDDGCTYDFHLRSGDDAYRFNTGETVTARHFAAAIARALNPAMDSPAVAYLREIVGSDDVIEGERAGAPAGVSVLSDTRLRIELTRPVPDFLHRLAMPFFAAIPPDLPATPDGVDTVPSAGPYYIDARVRGSSISLRRNPFYRHSRPANVDRIVYSVGVDPDRTLAEIERGDVDYVADGLPPDAEQSLGERYGVNAGQFHVSVALQLDYIAMNTSRPLFSDVRIRRAANFALDRRAHLESRGEYAGVVSDHILPPGMPGYRDETTYPLDGPDVARARAELPPGFTGAHAVFYTNDTLAGPTIGELVRRDLRAIGIDVEVKQFPETLKHRLAGRRDEPFDFLVTGDTAEYPDPYVLINALLDGDLITEQNNVNESYFNDPVYNRRMHEAAALYGEERARAYGQLDLDITRDAAPWAVMDNRTKRDLVSSRVRGAFHHALYGIDLAALWLEPA